MEGINNLLAAYLYQFSLLIWEAFRFNWIGGFLAGLALVMKFEWGSREQAGRAKLAWWVFMLCIAVWVGGYFTFNFMLSGEYVRGTIPQDKIEQFFWFLVGGGAVGFILLRKMGNKFEQLTQRIIKKSRLERHTKTDIRFIKEFLPERKKSFDPQKFFNRKKGVLCGLDEHRRPIFIPPEVWMESQKNMSRRKRQTINLDIDTYLKEKYKVFIYHSQIL